MRYFDALIDRLIAPQTIIGASGVRRLLGSLHRVRLWRTVFCDGFGESGAPQAHPMRNIYEKRGAASAVYADFGLFPES